MKVTLTHDGKSVELDLTAEQMTALGLKEEKKKTGYERCKNGDFVYTVGRDDSVCTEIENHYDFIGACYDNANYYSNARLASINARADRLMRQLRRFAAENGGIPSPEDYKNNANHATQPYHSTECLEIVYSYYERKLSVSDYFVCKTLGAVTFKSREVAAKAIELYHDELIWYFTEYEAMLR